MVYPPKVVTQDIKNVLNKYSNISSRIIPLLCVVRV